MASLSLPTRSAERRSACAADYGSNNATSPTHVARIAVIAGRCTDTSDSSLDFSNATCDTNEVVMTLVYFHDATFVERATTGNQFSQSIAEGKSRNATVPGLPSKYIRWLLVRLA
jgi:hypothetical protein